MTTKTKTTSNPVAAISKELKKHGGEAGTKDLFAALKARFNWTFPRQILVYLLDHEGKKFLLTGRQTWALKSHGTAARRVSAAGKKR